MLRPGAGTFNAVDQVRAEGYSECRGLWCGVGERAGQLESKLFEIACQFVIDTLSIT